MAVSDQALPVPAPRCVKAASSTSTTITLTAADLAAETASTVARAERVLPVVVAQIERYAQGAPVAVKNEAAIRFGGYLLQSDYGAIRTETLGPKSAEYQMNHAAMFRNSGAAALLTNWKVRRGGATG